MFSDIILEIIEVIAAPRNDPTSIPSKYLDFCGLILLSVLFFWNFFFVILGNRNLTLRLLEPVCFEIPIRLFKIEFAFEMTFIFLRCGTLLFLFP